MWRLVKTLGKRELCGLVTGLLFIVLANGSCRKAASEVQSAVDLGDEKVAMEQIAAAEPLYDQREDLSKVRSAVAQLRQARTADYGSYEASWKLARADYYLGEHTTVDSERDDLFREGIDAGKAAVQLQPDKPDGHFWLGANYGGRAAHSTLSSLSTVEDIRQEMETVIRLDPGYQSGSAYMVLGQLYLEAPRALGGDSSKAVDYLEKGLKFGADNSQLRFRLAEAYEAVNRESDARKQINFILSMTAVQGYVPEHKEAVEKAKKLQDKIAGK